MTGGLVLCVACGGPCIAFSCGPGASVSGSGLPSCWRPQRRPRALPDSACKWCIVCKSQFITLFTNAGARVGVQLIQLRTNIALPDNGELNWPLDVPDSFEVHDARVTLTGLYHPYPEDLVYVLRYCGCSLSATLFVATR